LKSSSDNSLGNPAVAFAALHSTVASKTVRLLLEPDSGYPGGKNVGPEVKFGGSAISQTKNMKQNQFSHAEPARIACLTLQNKDQY
jgi:hypothetical protein